jgi:hypothetical protein
LWYYLKQNHYLGKNEIVRDYNVFVGGVDEWSSWAWTVGVTRRNTREADPCGETVMESAGT